MMKLDDLGYPMAPMGAFSPVGKRMPLYIFGTIASVLSGGSDGTNGVAIPDSINKADKVTNNGTLQVAQDQLVVADYATQQLLDLGAQQTELAGLQASYAADQEEFAQKQAEAAAAQQAAALQYLNFAQDQYADDMVFGQMITDIQLGMSEEVRNSAQQNLERGAANTLMEEKYVRPIQERIMDDALNYNTEQKREQLAGLARADVETAYDQEADRTNREMARFGINPNSGRFASINRQLSMSRAGDTASAMNKARMDAEEIAYKRLTDAEGIGRQVTQNANQAYVIGQQGSNLASTIAGSSLESQGFAGNRYNTAMATGLTGLGGAASSYGGASNSMGNAGDTIGNAINSYGNAGATFSNATVPYGNVAATLNGGANTLIKSGEVTAQTQLANAEQENEIGGAVIGSIASAASAFSSKDYKTNKKSIPEGKAIKGIKNLDVEQWDYKRGISDGKRHIGAYAEDFKRQFGIGDGKTINMQDAIGVTMKAIQDLSKEVETLRRGMANGGKAERKRGAIKGPGGPVDDLVPAMLSDGEYVLPADTTKRIGVKNLDALVKQTHTPAHIQRQKQRGIRRK